MSENNVFLGQQAAEMIAHGTKEQIDKNRINYQLTDDNAGILISGGFGGNTQNDSLTNGIDVNNLITTIPAAAEQTYTATEDCFILTYCVAGSDKSVVIYLDEVLVASTYSNSSIISITQTIFVAKGQTVKVVRNLSNFDREIYVYGIKDKLKCYTYDTKEHIVGTWVDGSIIYEKIIKMDDYISSMSSGNWYDVTDMHCDFLIQHRLCGDSEISNLTGFEVQVTNGKLRVCQSRGGSWSMNNIWLLIQYTKN